MMGPARQPKARPGLWAVLFPDCREVARLQSEGLGQELTALRRLGLRLHLVVCGWCRRYGRHIRFLRQAAGESADAPAAASPVGLTPAARERLRRALQQGTEKAPGT